VDCTAVISRQGTTFIGADCTVDATAPSISGRVTRLNSNDMTVLQALNVFQNMCYVFCDDGQNATGGGGVKQGGESVITHNITMKIASDGNDNMSCTVQTI
jgi:hypothetical protein